MLCIAKHEFSSRLFLGTGKFNNKKSMIEAVKSSESEMVTMALRRVNLSDKSDDILSPLIKSKVKLLPNTSGARNAKEAIYAAQLAREALSTNWIKLEIHPDPKYLMPDPVETLNAAVELVKQGFIVLPYIHADPVICKRLEEAGCAAVMPLGSPIGSNMGLLTKDFIKIIIDQSNVPVIVDAGIGRPSDAALAMELGADAVLVNTAIAVAQNPESMGAAFRMAVIAGRLAYKSGVGSKQITAIASSPLTAFLENS